MIEVKRLAAQGDVLFRRIDHLPFNVVEQQRRAPIVVAHSETGHHHVVEGADVRLLANTRLDAEWNPLVSFLAIEGEFADVVHRRPYDTHETLRLGRGLWEVRRQREWIPEGQRPVLD